MDNGVVRGADTAGKGARPFAIDALAAVLATEAVFVDRVAAVYPPALLHQDGRANAFGDALTFERGDDVAALARRLGDLAGEGERVTMLAPPEAYAAARMELERIAGRRLPVVFHAFCDRGARGAYPLAGLGWAVLLASGVQDGIDLALVARRAAEDSGTPFFVVHERGVARHLEAVLPPDPGLAEAFLGPKAARVPRLTDAAHPSHAQVGERAFSERVPFALGSAMRGLEAFTGRKHDVLERTLADGAAMMLVGAGALGEALLGEADRLKAAGHDVGAIRVTALRPFPGPRLIRALGRAHVVAVLESFDDPLAQSNPLTGEVKAAFADALTWAPEYPGIGRLPHIHSGVVLAAGLASGDVDAVARNMGLGEQGQRFFTLGPPGGASLVHDGAPAPYAPGRLSISGRLADASTADACAELCATVVFSALALKSRVSVGHEAGTSGTTFDLVAGRERPRGVLVPHEVGVVALDDASAFLSGNPLARLKRGGVLAVPTSQTEADALWGELPAYVKAIAFDRDLRVLGLPVLVSSGSEHAASAHRWSVAAAFAGVALFALGGGATVGRPAVDGSLVEREVILALDALGAPRELHEAAGRLARRTFEAPLEVPRATIERDLAAVKLGRHDARAV